MAQEESSPTRNHKLEVAERGALAVMPMGLVHADRELVVTNENFEANYSGSDGVHFWNRLNIGQLSVCSCKKIDRIFSKFRVRAKFLVFSNFWKTLPAG